MGHRHFLPTSDYCCQPCSPALFAGIPLRVRLFALMLISVTLLGASGIAVASFPATLITLSRPTGRRPPPLSFPGPPSPYSARARGPQPHGLAAWRSNGRGQAALVGPVPSERRGVSDKTPSVTFREKGLLVPEE